MKLSIIIRCLNEEKHIGRLLAGIAEQTLQEVEVILVDSGSTDATLSIAEHFPTRIISIRPEDFSFGYALNVGCAAATATSSCLPALMYIRCTKTGSNS